MDKWEELQQLINAEIAEEAERAAAEITPRLYAKISEMLDDPEKFLGKAEPDKVEYSTFGSDGGGMTYILKAKADNDGRGFKYESDLHYTLRETVCGRVNSGYIIAAFRDEELLNRVVKLLEGEK